MCYIKILLFLLILILALCLYPYLLNTVSVLKSANSAAGGFIQGGFAPVLFSNYKNKPKHVMIVDVANLHAYWYEKTFKKPLYYFNQQILFQYYLEAMKAHHKKHGKKYMCHYVLKNYRYVGKNTKALTINSKDIKTFQGFCKKYKAMISIAQDYTGVKKSIWDKKRYHYVRERDDFLCLWLAKVYKKSYIKATIMTNDMFKDFQHFGFIPEFIALHINDRKTATEKIKPRPNVLGQLRDYHTTLISF